MKIVIDIDEEVYKNAMDGIWCKALFDAIKNGTPLPKGHGNIYDENDVKKGIKNPYQCLYGLSLIKPIIEADKSESEDKNE